MVRRVQIGIGKQPTAVCHRHALPLEVQIMDGAMIHPLHTSEHPVGLQMERRVQAGIGRLPTVERSSLTYTIINLNDTVYTLHRMTTFSLY